MKNNIEIVSNALVSNKKDMEKTFYCRQRECKHHKGFKNGNVLCEMKAPKICDEENGHGSYCKSFS